MNVSDARYGPGLWVCLHLPDGRDAIADGTDPADAPVVAAIRRIHAATVLAGRPDGEGSPRDYATVAAWMDEREPLPDGLLFTWEAAA